MASSSLSFLAELVARWKAKSPSFFKVITTISTILLFITGVPTLLEEFGVVDLIPANVNEVIVKVVAAAALATSIISKLTVATPDATERVLEKIDAGVPAEAAKAAEETK